MWKLVSKSSIFGFCSGHHTLHVLRRVLTITEQGELCTAHIARHESSLTGELLKRIIIISYGNYNGNNYNLELLPLVA